MEFKDYLKIVSRRWYILLSVFILVGLVHYLYVRQQKPSYMARAEIVAQDASYKFNDMSWVNKDSKIRSLEVFQTAAGYLHEGNGSQLNSQGEVLREFDFTGFKQTSFYRSLLFSAKEDYESLNEQEKKKHSEESLVIHKLQSSLRSIVNIPENSEDPWANAFVEITASSGEPEVARCAVNALALAADQYYLKKAQSFVTSKLEKISKDRLPELTIQNEELENRREQFWRDALLQSGNYKPGYNFHEKEKILLASISDLTRKIESLETEALQNKFKRERKVFMLNFNQLKKLLEEGFVFEHPELLALREEIRTAKQDLAKLKSGPPARTEKNPEVVQAKSRIETLEDEYEYRLDLVKKREHKKALSQEEDLLNESQLIEAKITQYEGFLDQRRKELEKVSSLRKTLEEINKESEEIEKEREDLLAQKDELQDKQAQTGGLFKIYEWSRPEDLRELPVKGASPSDMILTALLGLIAGLFCAYSVDYLDTRVSNEYEIRKYLNLPVLGFVPNEKRARLMLNHASPFSDMGEAFNFISSVIMAKTREDDQKVIMVSSTKPGEGKTTISVNLAVTLARKRNRVILVDCDMRRSCVHEHFGIENTSGLSNLLEGVLDSDRIIKGIIDTDENESASLVEKFNLIEQHMYETEVEGLQVLPTGPIPADPVYLLESRTTRLLFAQLRDKADYVIVDTPPLKMVGDALSVAPLVDTNIIVACVGMADRQELTWTKKMLANVHPDILGVILNRSREQKRREYYYYYSGDKKRVHSH